MTRQVTRRAALAALGASAGGLLLAGRGHAAASHPQAHPRRAGGPPATVAAPLVYLGAYTHGDATHGIGVASAPDGGGVHLEAVTPTDNPSFLALSPTTPVLYAANETDDGRVSAFALDADGRIAGALGSASSGGASPCHLSVHPSGRHLFVANYSSGTVAVVALGADGDVGETVQVVQHEGVDPHAHMVLPDASGERLYAVDLGTDSVHTYRFDAAAGQLTAEVTSTMAPGSGPRHLAWHPSGATAYVLGELDSTLTACSHDPSSGALTPVTSVSTLPEGTDPGGNSTAEVLVTYDGAFVYASNRGHDSIAVFAVEGDAATAPRLLETYPCGGSGPRHMSFDATQGLLYVANQNTGNVVTFQRSATDGALTPVGEPLAYAQAVCVLPALG